MVFCIAILKQKAHHRESHSNYVRTITKPPKLELRNACMSLQNACMSMQQLFLLSYSHINDQTAIKGYWHLMYSY